MAKPKPLDDRRAKRTREALLHAFLKLLGERRYKNIRVADIAAAADTGRSTFYEHFKDKNDLLFFSMTFHFAVLTDIVNKDASVDKLAQLLDHFWDNRQLAREVMIGPQAPLGAVRGTRHLARLIDARLMAVCREKKIKPAVPTALAATHIAEGTLSLLRAWLMGEAPAKPAALAKAIHASALGAVAAFMAAR